MPVKTVKRAVKERWASALLVAATILACGATGFGVITLVERNEAIRETLVEGCNRGNVLRTGLREYFIGERTKARHLDPALFPDIPIEVFNKLNNENIRRLSYNINVRFADVDCEKEYNSDRIHNPIGSVGL